jgi:hypothetical protein
MNLVIIITSMAPIFVTIPAPLLCMFIMPGLYATLVKMFFMRI